MPVSALVLALAAAVVHALWNVLLARAHDPQAATVVALIVAELVFAPVTWVAWRVDGPVWPYIAGTGVLQLVYFSLLAAAYAATALSVVYPVARGTAPVLVLVAGVVLLGRGTSVGQVGGVCVVALGVLLVRGLQRGTGRGVAYGLAIAACIATYTLVDKEGIRYAGAVPYLELSMLVPTLVYAAAVIRAKGAAAVRAEVNLSSAIAGIATFGAYCLVLLALQRAPAAPVAAVRETSVVLTAVLARRVLREQAGTTRLIGAALVAVGIAVLAFAQP